MRNEFAHSLESHPLHDGPCSALVAKLRVPKRQFFEWGQLRAAATDSGVVLFTGEPPVEAGEDLDVSKITFRMGASVLVAVLAANLGIPIEAEDAADAVVVELPEHMREIPE